MKKIILCLVIVFFGAMSQRGIGQEVRDSTVIYRLTTADGNEYFGTILSENSEIIRLSTTNLGEINLLKENITSIEAIKTTQIKNGKVWYPNLQSTRYFFAPNAYGLKKGEVYYQNVWVMFNQVSVGVINNFSIGAGIIPLFLIAGAPTPVWLIPKVSIPIVKDKFAVGAGALIGGVIGEKDLGFGILYGITTFGSRNANFSLGVGYGYMSGEWARYPVINISGYARVSSRTYLITENYFLGGESTNLLISMGGRTLVHRVGIDYGLILPILAGQGINFAIPWFGVTVPLHKAKVDKR